MSLHTTDTVCGITGILPSTLRNWRRAGLISAPERPDGYSNSQLNRIFTVLGMTASGDSLSEIRSYLQGDAFARHSGWECRQEELISQLQDKSDELLKERIRQIGRDYSGEDFVNAYLRPLNLWLRADLRDGSEIRQGRFHSAVVRHARDEMNAAHRRRAVPLFLEAVSVTDLTEIWMEAIRLTGQGFRVEISPHASGEPAIAEQYYEHHLMWCGNGISDLMNTIFRSRHQAGHPALLCGPDQTIRA